jgi:hypothetical protein
MNYLPSVEAGRRVMQVYEFRRDREVALTSQRDGRNLPAGLVWEPIAVVDAALLRPDIASVLSEVGFFIWP